MRSQFLVIVFVVLLASSSTAQTPPDRLQRILESGTLRVGTTMDTPVFSMRTSSGQLEGFDMDTLATLAPALGVKIDYVKMTFGSMLGDLAADKFDIAMSGMGRTFDRARTATFSKPYMRYGKLIAVRRGSTMPSQISSTLPNLHGATFDSNYAILYGTGAEKISIDAQCDEDEE
jgi:cyclohexadienyl dehydratase